MTERLTTRLRRMLSDRGTRCLVDAQGNPEAIRIDLNKRDNLWLDIQDILIARHRRRKRRITLFEPTLQQKNKVHFHTPRVVICHSAQRELNSLTTTGSERVKEAIRKLGSRAWPSQQSQQKARKLVPGEFTYRIRVTAFHVVYEVYIESDPPEAGLVVFIAHVRHRSESYQDLLRRIQTGEHL